MVAEQRAKAWEVYHWGVKDSPDVTGDDALSLLFYWDSERRDSALGKGIKKKAWCPLARAALRVKRKQRLPAPQLWTVLQSVAKEIDPLEASASKYPGTGNVLTREARREIATKRCAKLLPRGPSIPGWVWLLGAALILKDDLL